MLAAQLFSLAFYAKSENSDFSLQKKWKLKDFKLESNVINTMLYK